MARLSVEVDRGWRYAILLTTDIMKSFQGLIGGGVVIIVSNLKYYLIIPGAILLCGRKMAGTIPPRRHVLTA
jgi:hypothetical protein